MRRKKRMAFWDRVGQLASIAVLIFVLLGSVVIIPIGYLSVVLVMLAESAYDRLQKLSDWLTQRGGCQ